MNIDWTAEYRLVALVNFMETFKYHRETFGVASFHGFELVFTRHDPLEDVIDIMEGTVLVDPTNSPVYWMEVGTRTGKDFRTHYRFVC